jgi:endogenous inhibitor of DNA gyrase (YacG/DUF329 family)
MAVILCPVCHQPFDPEKAGSMPFCSERCRMVDLGRWLDERYSLPIEHSHDHDDGKVPPEEPYPTG